MVHRAAQLHHIPPGPSVTCSRTSAKKKYLKCYSKRLHFNDVMIITCFTHRLVVITWFFRLTSISWDNFRPNQTVRVSVLFTTGLINRL